MQELGLAYRMTIDKRFAERIKKILLNDWPWEETESELAFIQKHDIQKSRQNQIRYKEFEKAKLILSVK